jgi:hypothetical protein
MLCGAGDGHGLGRTIEAREGLVDECGSFGEDLVTGVGDD